MRKRVIAIWLAVLVCCGQMAVCALAADTTRAAPQQTEGTGDIDSETSPVDSTEDPPVVETPEEEAPRRRCRSHSALTRSCRLCFSPAALHWTAP